MTRGVTGRDGGPALRAGDQGTLVSGVGQCARIRPELGMYVLGAIAPAGRAMVNRHLESCSRCRDESAGLARLPALLRKAPIAAMQLSGERPGGGPGLPGRLLDQLLSRVAAVRRRRARVGDEPGRFHGEFWFPVTPEQLWVMIEQFDLFTSWWGWLREFRADGAGLVAGNGLHGTVVPPVPYRLRLDVRLQRCDRPRTVQAAVGGDLSGRAVLRLEDAGGGTRVAVAWSLEMRSVPLRLAARAAYPAVRWGHDRVVDMAVAGLRRTAGPAPDLTGLRPGGKNGPRGAGRQRCGCSRASGRAISRAR